MRRIYIDLHEVKASVVNAALDEALLRRPWWLIRKEPFSWAKGEADGIGASHIYLERYAQSLEPILWRRAGVQYPPTVEECGRSYLLIGHMVNSGWGSALSMYSMMLSSHQYKVFSTYDTNSNRPDESVMYAAPALCPQHLNKWLCAFLAPTTCTLPDQVTKCVDTNCWPSGFPFFSNATAAGIRYTDDEARRIPALSGSIGASTEYHLQLKAQFARHGELAHQTLYDAKDKLRTDRFPPTVAVVESFGFLLRLNAVYRSLVMQRIQQVWDDARQRGLPPLMGGIPCTGIHIRRGDRMYDGVDMNTFCKNYTHNGQGWANCTNIHTGELYSCLDLQDKGCFGVRPFGGITLQDYLDRAWRLHKTRHVFIMTDADDWLLQEREKIDQNVWKLYSIASHGHHDREHMHVNATAHGVAYFASIRIMQQCQAFVGHWGSAVSHMVFEAMCFSHHLSVGVCPSAADIGAAAR